MFAAGDRQQELVYNDDELNSINIPNFFFFFNLVELKPRPPSDTEHVAIDKLIYTSAIN